MSELAIRDRLAIRRLRWGENQQLEAVFEMALLHLCRGVYTPQQLQVLSKTNNPRQYRAHFVLVAAIERQVVGYTSLWGRTLQAMYVDPRYARQGIGRALLKAMEVRASERRIWQLKVNSSLNAESFYRACGFEVLNHTVTRYAGFDSIEIPVVTMAKKLRWTEQPLGHCSTLASAVMQEV
ncbi:GNAT family N-acetyltransferase [Synechococcus sp. PCC 7336]|uniref:GNAT family N-acetyltransferase n=1 Tax=Synechococcus sp. PCC 7336 TaxID=195250 RepID=UPI0003492549|nr:GNAT family N-acetyltransferase [Synechococcus sp. PCC 7336]